MPTSDPSNERAIAHPLVWAAIRFYRAKSLLNVVCSESARCPQTTAVHVTDSVAVLGIRDGSWTEGTDGADGEQGAPAMAPFDTFVPGEASIRVMPRAAPTLGTFDIIHIDGARPGCLARFFPHLSADGVLIAGSRNEDDHDALKCEAGAYADRHDLIAICQFGKVALSRVDVVALLNLTAGAEMEGAAGQPRYSAAFGTA